MDRRTVNAMNGVLARASGELDEQSLFLRATVVGWGLALNVNPDNYDQDAQDALRYVKKQRRGELSFLFSLLTTRLWTSLEAFVDDAARAILTSKTTRTREAVRKLKGELVDFATAPRGDQTSVLLRLLKDDLRCSYQPGVARFETLLNALGLGGSVPKEISRTLLELAEVRHVLVHRAGQIDAKLKKRCPWVTAKLGALVHLGVDEYERYSRAVRWYIVEVSQRFVASAGRERTDPHVPLIELVGAQSRPLRGRVGRVRKTPVGKA